MRRGAILVLLGLLVVGCGQAPARGSGAVTPPAPVTASPAAPVATPEAPAFATQVPAEPFWGAPGVAVYGSDGTRLSLTGAPVKINGLTLYPVSDTVPGQTYYYARSGDQLVLAATEDPMGGSWGLAQPPAPLFSLPYTPGATAPQKWPFTRISGTENLTTPAGTLPALVLETEEGVREWWSPGTGLVKRVMADGQTVVAVRIEHTTPTLPKLAQRISDKLTVLATDEGIYGPEAGPLVKLLHIDGRRPSVGWLDLGTGTPVLQLGLHSQGGPNWLEALYVYQPATGRFEPVTWRFPDGSDATVVAGSVMFDQGQVQFVDDERYPSTRFTFQWKGSELRATDVQESYPANEQQFMAELTRPLKKQNWVSLFADPALGEQAYAVVFQNGFNSLQISDLTPAGAAWEFHQVHGNMTVRLTLVKTAKDWRVATWDVR